MGIKCTGRCDVDYYKELQEPERNGIWDRFLERNGKTQNVNALHSGTEREDTERIMKRNGTERKRPYLDNEELPEALDWTNRILPVRSSFLAWFKKKLNIARGRPGGLGGGATQAHS